MGSISLDTKGVVGLSNKIASVDSVEIQDVVEGMEVDEKELLLPPRKGGMSRKVDKTRRKVQWNDRNGHSLVQVLEFEPSDQSDSDDEDLDSCICTIM
ncbi:hypothetical protein QQ045_032765 [Rhodiola kirilowii]